MEYQEWNPEYETTEGMITLSEGDNRLDGRNPHAPSFERKNNTTVLAEIKPDLDAEDITSGIQPELILVDRRLSKKKTEEREEKELQIMEWIDTTLDEITQKNLDTHHRIDEDLRQWCKKLILIASRKRTEYGLENYTHQDIKIDTREIWWTDHLHWDHNRKSGLPYAREHIFDGYKNLIVLSGLVGRLSRTAMLRHDDKEDLDEHKNHPEEIDETLLIAKPFYGEYTTDVTGINLEETLKTLKRLVEGLSQINLAKKSEKKVVGLIKLLETIISHPKGIIALAIKASERIDNISDISTNYEERQRPIIEETLNIYGHLTYIFKFYELHEAILKICAQFLNPVLVENFKQEQTTKGKKLITEGPTAEKLKNGLLELAGENKAITYIGVHPRPLQDYLQEGKELLKGDHEPIKISSRDWMHEIVIMTKSPKEVSKIRSQMVEKLTPNDTEERARTTSEKHPRGGTLFKIYNKELGGQLRIRVITEYEEALSLKGMIGESARKENTPPALIEAIGKVLNETADRIKNIIEGTEDDSDEAIAFIMKELHEKVFQKTITVRMPDGSLRKFPKGSTVIDVCAAHSSMLKNYGKAEIYEDDRSETPTAVPPWYVLEDDNHVEILDGKERTAPKTDLGWINFATTKEGIAAVKTYFSKGTNREKKSRGGNYLNRISKTINSGEIPEEKLIEILLSLKSKKKKDPQLESKLYTLKKGRAMEHGHPITIEKLDKRIDNEETTESERETALSAKRKLIERLLNQREKSDEIINMTLEEIGKGELNPLTLLGEAVEIGSEGLSIAITLNNRPREGDEIIKMISNEEINIENINTEEIDENVDGNKKILHLTLKANQPDTPGYNSEFKVITPIDLLKCLLKIQYGHPSIQVTSNQFKDLIAKKARMNIPGRNK